MTYVTCPTMRYHPAVVAQKAATLQILADGRFILGLGSGENLNEHIIGEGWPPVAAAPGHARGGRSRSSASCTRASWSPGRASTSASTPRASGTCRTAACRSASRSRATKSIERFAPLGDHLIAVEPDADARRRAGTRALRSAAGSRKIGQIPICWAPTEGAAIAKAHDQFRWFGGGWAVNADLPTPARVRRRRASSSVPRTSPSRSPAGRTSTRSPRASAVLEAGFTDIALVQVGDEGQQRFLDEAAGPLLERLRSAARTSGPAALWPANHTNRLGDQWEDPGDHYKLGDDEPASGDRQ